MAHQGPVVTTRRNIKHLVLVHPSCFLSKLFAVTFVRVVPQLHPALIYALSCFPEPCVSPHGMSSLLGRQEEQKHLGICGSRLRLLSPCLVWGRLGIPVCAAVKLGVMYEPFWYPGVCWSIYCSCQHFSSLDQCEVASWCHWWLTAPLPPALSASPTAELDKPHLLGLSLRFRCIWSKLSWLSSQIVWGFSLVPLWTHSLPLPNSAKIILISMEGAEQEGPLPSVWNGVCLHPITLIPR